MSHPKLKNKPRTKLQSLRNISNKKDRIVKIDTTKSKPFEKDRQHDAVEEKETQDLLKKTTIAFGSSKNQTKSQGILWTSQNWMTNTSTPHLLLKKKSTFLRENEEDYLNYDAKIKNNSERTLPKYEPRDTQTILRKNSLFLLNFIRTRERKKMKNPHIG